MQRSVREAGVCVCVCVCLHFLNWNIIALQYCVSFYWTTLWISHVYIHIFPPVALKYTHDHGWNTSRKLWLHSPGNSAWCPEMTQRAGLGQLLLLKPNEHLIAGRAAWNTSRLHDLCLTQREALYFILTFPLMSILLALTDGFCFLH